MRRVCELHLLFSLAGLDEYGIKVLCRSCTGRERLLGIGAGKNHFPSGKPALGSGGQGVEEWRWGYLVST